ncbi:MAG: hypothetical protein ACPGRZ_08130 [Alphaproteobacteria bacterium]
MTESDFLLPPADVQVSGAGSSTATTPLSGGNPGSYRDISLALNVGEGRAHFELVDGISFDPSAQGAISSVAVQYDVRRTFTSTFDALQVARYVVAEQGGVWHTHFGGVTTSASFTTFAVADLVPLLPGVDWISGGEIRFGFGNSAFAGLGTPFTIAGGYDNYQVTVNFTEIPIAATGTLFLFGVSALHISRRRRKMAA